MFATTILGFTFTTMWLFGVLFLSFLVAFWPAMIAKRKGHSFFLYFLLSIPFWWITFFVVIFLKDKNVKSSASSVSSEE